MNTRIGVNSAATELANLTRGRLTEDPFVIHPLMQRLNHPLLEVSRNCEDALGSLTLDRLRQRLKDVSALSWIG